ncbi:MAG: hypothetical protein GEU28_04570 [Dehalococcoidia bacterium]|nr:hypothetical protein [Dehalococcoidia bacterium]
MRAMVDAAEMLSGLARTEEVEGALVLSVYLDLRPQETGGRPALRSGEIVLRDRLREIERTLGHRGPAIESFKQDAGRLQQYLAGEVAPSTQGLAAFACSATGLFDVIETGVAFDNQVSAGRTARLYQLARLVDEYETAVTALVDTNSARLFVTRLGQLEERGGIDDDPVHYQKRSTGGWSEARYQRHIEKHQSDFLQAIAAEVAELVNREGATRLVLVGNEVAIPRLRGFLPSSLSAAVEERRLDMRADRNEVQQEVDPILRRLEEEDSRAAADRLVAAVQSGDLGASGVEHVRSALERGQVDVLVLEDSPELDKSARNELARLAAQTSATVEVVEGHDGLTALGGVGALLRYNL